MTKKPVMLMILDGYGYNPATEGNAIYSAKTPVMDKLMAQWTERNKIRPSIQLIRKLTLPFQRNQMMNFHISATVFFNKSRMVIIYSAAELVVTNSLLA